MQIDIVNQQNEKVGSLDLTAALKKKILASGLTTSQLVTTAWASAAWASAACWP